MSGEVPSGSLESSHPQVDNSVTKLVATLGGMGVHISEVLQLGFWGNLLRMVLRS